MSCVLRRPVPVCARFVFLVRGVGLLLLAVLIALGSAAKCCAIVIGMPYVGPPAPPPVMDGIALSSSIAISRFTSHFSDPVVLHFKISPFEAPGSGILGYFDVDSATSAFSYSDVKAALDADKTSSVDILAVGSLQPGPALNMITNDTTSAPSLRMHVTAPEVFNSTLRLTRANQKVLGLLPGSDGGIGADGTFFVNASYFPVMDFDPTDGIDPGKLDFTAILTHEMAHGMGFISGVDHIDFASSDGGGMVAPDHPLDYSGETIFTVLDLFRYSADSTTIAGQPSSGAVLDWAAGTSGLLGDNPYFSYDGGVTHSALFSTGIIFGDGFQAQHWKDSSFTLPGPPFGLLDPDLDSGELGVMTALDYIALDVIGYTLVPEPSGFYAASLAVMVATSWLSRRRSR